MHTTYLFLGDSITDANHLWLPECHNLGNGYVSRLASRLDPTDTILNQGMDGFTVFSLLERLSRGFLTKQPNVISLLIGINDIGTAVHTKRSLTALQVESNYRQVLSLLCDTDAAILCCGPFIFPHPQEYQLWIPYIRELEQIMMQVTAEMQLTFLPLHDYLNSLILHGQYDALTTDGIHLTPYGHELLADYLLPHLHSMAVSVVSSTDTGNGASI